MSNFTNATNGTIKRRCFKGNTLQASSNSVKVINLLLSTIIIL